MARMRREELSEVVAGLLMEGKLAVTSVDPRDLVEPYSQLPKLFRKGIPTTEDLISALGPMPYQAALHAARSIKDLPANWPTLLQQASVRHEAGAVMDKMARKLLMGDEVDLTPLHAAVARMDKSQRQLMPLSKIEPDHEPFVETGYEPIDAHIGGLPRAGLTVIAGPPGTGKTWMLMKLAAAFAKKRKKVAIFSLEMTAQQFAKRCVAASLTKSQINYIDICDDLMSVAELSTIVSRADKVDFIGVDFAELMLDGDSMQTEQVMANIYRTLAWVAKRLGVPVVLLSQLNRSHNGQLPSLTMLRYTGMAEALAALVLFLHNPTQVFIQTSDQLPLVEGRAFIIVAKSRFGYANEVHSGVGAIQLGWEGAGGWGDKSYGWYPLNGA